MSGPYKAVEMRRGIFRIDGPAIGEFLVASDDLAERITRALNAAYAAGRELVDSLFDAIAHGDDEHRAWLKKAIDDHFAGRVVERQTDKDQT